MVKRNTENVLEVSELNTWYGDRKILSDINLSVSRNEIMVIMGHSGSGKSTLLRYILGLEKIKEGIIKLLNKEVAKLSKDELYKLRKRIGVAFQSGALFNSMTVGENIELPLHENTDLDENTIKIMSRIKLELMQLSGTESLMPAELSGGMLKRAGLARAVIMDPELLFFDEPSAGLDPITSAHLDNLILQLRDTLNMSIIVVTHELESAFKIADRITILDKGEIILVGSKEVIKKSNDSRIINMLERRAISNPLDAKDYLNRLTKK
jgi:phospholipid/cholesterol/gamma-HCH transport system ATP-binding protein|tara:strand:- start:2491 stop:3291 length:801 start_codon:yes stop_codon:yes gene_type:complete